MSVVIETITEAHIEGFYRALDAVSRERKYLAFLEAPPLTKVREFVMNNISRGFPQFVCMAKGDVIGWCDIIPHERPIHAHCGVLGIGLLPQFRGAGHGSSLMAATLNAAERRGLKRIELTVHASNLHAVALYEKCGFQREGVMRDAICIDGRYEDCIMMAYLMGK